LHHFVDQDRFSIYPGHVQAHPPGMVLLLWSLGRIGLGGLGWATALVIAAGASVVPAALIAMRELRGSPAARAAAPFLAFAPIALWIATSADALFAGVAAWGVTLSILATGRRDRRGDLLAIAGGLLLGASIFLSYGLVLLWIVPVVVAGARRHPRTLVLAGLSVTAVVAAFGLFGFWWWRGLSAGLHAYFVRDPRVGPNLFFVVSNLAAFSLALGPAAAAGLARLRDRRLWLLAGGALVAVLVADVSGLSKGEVERIWLPFAPWVLVAAAAVRTDARRAWLGAQALTALALQVGIRTPW
jgi:hypothetical protein